jgi:hypothetical protein
MAGSMSPEEAATRALGPSDLAFDPAGQVPPCQLGRWPGALPPTLGLCQAKLLTRRTRPGPKHRAIGRAVHTGPLASPIGQRAAGRLRPMVPQCCYCDASGRNWPSRQARQARARSEDHAAGFRSPSLRARCRRALRAGRSVHCAGRPASTRAPRRPRPLVRSDLRIPAA